MTCFPHLPGNRVGPRPLWVKAKALPAVPRYLWIPVLLSLFLALATNARAEGYNHAPFNDLLAAHVRGGGIDYEGLSADEATLDAYLAPAQHFSSEGLSRDDAMAFWINMYNAWTLKLILTHYPDLTSIKDIGSIFSSPWKKQFVMIGGKTLSLGDIEHEILRKKFADPRIHFAINCASKSCPPLLPEVYRGDTLDAQLDGATVAFINNTANTRIDGNRLSVSRIFKWYQDDFENDIPAYVSKYASASLKQRIEKLGTSPDVDFMDYDWSLNTPGE